MSKSEYLRLMGGSVGDSTPPLQNKRRNIKNILDGYKFDSLLESRRYEALRQWNEIGVITDLCLEHKRGGSKDLKISRKHLWILQEPFTDREGVKHRAIVYTDDFQYKVDGVLVIEDIKGWSGPDFRRTEKMFRFKYPDVNFFVNQEVTRLWFSTPTNR